MKNKSPNNVKKLIDLIDASLITLCFVIFGAARHSRVSNYTAKEVRNSLAHSIESWNHPMSNSDNN